MEKTSSTSLIERFGLRYGVDKSKVLGTLTQTAFKTGPNEAPITQEEMICLLIVAEQYKLNPFTREIYAFRGKNGGISPVLGIDGWNRLGVNNPTYDGHQVVFSDKTITIGDVSLPEWAECIVKRKGIENPVIVREYARECYRPTGPWKQWPCRMLRHKATIQGFRTAFGLSGISDEDEVRTFSEVADTPQGTVVTPAKTKTAYEARGLSREEFVDKVISTFAQRGKLENALGYFQNQAHFTGDDLAYAKAQVELARHVEDVVPLHEKPLEDERTVDPESGEIRNQESVDEHSKEA